MSLLRSPSNRSVLDFGLGVLLGVALMLGGHYLLPDWEYHLRALWNDSTLFVCGARVRELKEREGEEGSCVCACGWVVEVPLRVLPFHIDRNQHMNNARYVYELNFTRRYAFNRLGIAAFVKDHGGNLIIQSQTIRYRRELRLNDKYIVRTSIVGWSDSNRCFYVESRFLNQQDAFVLAIHLAKYRIVPVARHCQAQRLESDALLAPSKILAALDLVRRGLVAAERVPKEVVLWEQFNTASSQALNPLKASIQS